MKKVQIFEKFLFLLILSFLFSCVSKGPAGFKLSTDKITDNDIHEFQKYVDTEVGRLNYNAFAELLTKDFIFISKPTKNEVSETDRAKYLNGVKKVCSKASRIENKTRILNIFKNKDGLGAIYEFEQLGKIYYGNYLKESFGIFEVHILKTNNNLMIRKIILKADTGDLTEWGR